MKLKYKFFLEFYLKFKKIYFSFVCRAYIMAGKGIIGLSDGTPNSFLKLKMGKNEINAKSSTLFPQTSNPDYYKCFEFNCSIPGSSFLRIEVIL